MWKSIIKYGVAGALVTIVYLQGLYYLGLMYHETGQYSGYLAILILPFTIFLALRDYALKREPAGVKGFIAVVLYGLAVSVIAALIYCAWIYVEVNVLKLSPHKEMIELTVNGLKEEGKTETEIAEKVEKMHKHYHSAAPYLGTIVWYLGLGLVSSTVSYVFLKLKFQKQK